MSSWTAASSDCSQPVNNYVHVKTADLYRPNARLTPERQGYQVLTPFGKLGYSQYPRYGYRKIRIFLARRGHPMRAERTYRLWRQAGLHAPRRRPRRRVATRRPRSQPPTARNHVWAYDFVFDTCADGRSLKCVTIVDECTRECLAIDVAGSIRSGRVIDVLGPLGASTAPRALCGPITGRSASRPLCSAGCTLRRSTRRSSIRASPGRMARTNRATGRAGTNACPSSGFGTGWRPQSGSNAADRAGCAGDRPR